METIPRLAIETGCGDAHAGEQEELIGLSDQVEERTLRRARALVELAARRGVSARSSPGTDGGSVWSRHPMRPPRLSARLRAAGNSLHRRPEEFIKALSVLPVNSGTAAMHGRLKAAILDHFGPKERGKRRRTTIANLGISDNDLGIAATALRHSLTIVSSDSDFERIRQLRPLHIADWMPAMNKPSIVFFMLTSWRPNGWTPPEKGICPMPNVARLRQAERASRTPSRVTRSAARPAPL